MKFFLPFRHSETSTAKLLSSGIFLIALLTQSAVLPLFSEANELKLIRIGTGGKTGVYYPIGKIIAEGLTGIPVGDGNALSGENGTPGYIGVAQNSAGSVENARRVAGGEIEAGLVQADVALRAFEENPPFIKEDQTRSIRAVASLYPEKFQIVTRRDAQIRRFQDLQGKRISIDEQGSGTLAVMRILLEAHGMSEEDLSPVYLKPVFTQDKILNGELQGFVMMAGVPMDAVTQISDIGISLVPISESIATAVEKKHPYLVPGRIPAGAYSGIPETPTIQVFALFIVHEAMEEDLVYQITAALWSHRTLSLLKAGHPQGRSISPETALEGFSIPLHPGAEKYYREHPDRFRFNG